MSTWTKQNLFELGTGARGKSKHCPRQHPAAPIVSFAILLGYLTWVCIETVL